MTFSQLAADTSKVEITNIMSIGLWVLAGTSAYFVPFAQYPAFRQGTVDQIVNAQQPAPDQFYWPDLDIDIEAAALDEPERFPLQFQRG